MHDPAAVVPDGSGHQIQVLAEGTVGGVLVLTGQARITGDICVQNHG
jgi:hypothetical protein